MLSSISFVCHQFLLIPYFIYKCLSNPIISILFYFSVYDVFKEDDAAIPRPTTIINLSPLGKIGFYLYYLKAGLRVPTSTFFGQIIDAYKIHTFLLKPTDFQPPPSKIGFYLYYLEAGL